MWLWTLIIFILILGCNRGKKELREQTAPPDYKEEFVKIGRYRINTEDRLINGYISRHHLNMKQSETGLRYIIFRQGTGKPAEKGRTAVFHYTVKLLNGFGCYSSKMDTLPPKPGREKKPLNIRIGYEEIESGLEEGLLLLREGDRAVFILPSFLAFGFPGDGKCIPPHAPLVYDVELMEVLNN